MISAAPAVLRLVVPGIAPSINARFGVSRSGRLYERTKTKEYKKRIHSIALGEVFRTTWKHRQDPIQVSIWLYGLRTDIDASVKATLDALEGVVYDNDKQVQRLLVERVKERSSAQLIVEVQPWCS